MKYVKLYESYISEKYITYDKMGNWGNSSDIEDDLKMTLVNILRYYGISNQLGDVIYTDQSSDKGIKWQIEVKGKGSDIIHAYKDGKMRGEYEWYLNKKKSSKYDIQQYFLNKYVSKLEQYYHFLKNFDIDKKYHKHFKSQDEYQAQAKKLADLYSSMSSAEQQKAHTQYVKQFKQDVELDNFKGY